MSFARSSSSVSSPFAMSTRAFIAVLAVGLCFCTGCLKFGNDTELLAPKVTAQHLQQVSSLTGIRFPNGSTGLAYYYLGSGIDDALAAKIAIPADQKDAFLQNEIFQKGSKNAPNIQIGKPKAWWKIDSLTDRTDRTLQLPQARFVECTLGVEDGKLVVYISWIST
jgi:hypothetical protein